MKRVHPSLVHVGIISAVVASLLSGCGGKNSASPVFPPSRSNNILQKAAHFSNQIEALSTNGHSCDASEIAQISQTLSQLKESTVSELENSKSAEEALEVITAFGKTFTKINAAANDCLSLPETSEEIAAEIRKQDLNKVSVEETTLDNFSVRLQEPCSLETHRLSVLALNVFGQTMSQNAKQLLNGAMDACDLTPSQKFQIFQESDLGNIKGKLLLAKNSSCSEDRESFLNETIANLQKPVEVRADGSKPYALELNIRAKMLDEANQIKNACAENSSAPAMDLQINDLQSDLFKLRSDPEHCDHLGAISSLRTRTNNAKAQDLGLPLSEEQKDQLVENYKQFQKNLNGIEKNCQAVQQNNLSLVSIGKAKEKWAQFTLSGRCSVNRGTEGLEAVKAISQEILELKRSDRALKLPEANKEEIFGSYRNIENQIDAWTKDCQQRINLKKQKDEENAALEKKKEEERLAAEEKQKADDAKKAEEERVAAEARKVEAEKAAEAERLADEARKAEEARLAEETVKAEEAAKQANLEKLEQIKRDMKARELRKMWAKKRAEWAKLRELAKKAEEARLAKEAKIAEENRLAEEARKAEQARLAEEAKKAEEAKIAEQKRLAEEQLQADLAKKAEEARVAEAARKEAEEQAAMRKKRAQEIRRAWERKRAAAEKERREEEARQAEISRKLEEARIAEEKRQAEEARIAEENARKSAEQQKQAEEAARQAAEEAKRREKQRQEDSGTLVIASTDRAIKVKVMKTVGKTEVLSPKFRLPSGLKVKVYLAKPLLKQAVANESGKVSISGDAIFRFKVLDGNGKLGGLTAAQKSILENESVYAGIYELDPAKVVSNSFDEPLPVGATKISGLSWDRFNPSSTWSYYVVEALQKKQNSHLVDKPPSDINEFCPKFKQLSINQRYRFWAAFVAEISSLESAFVPFNASDEGTITPGMNGIFSTGLTQISIGSVKGNSCYKERGCSDIRDSMDLINPRRHLSCAIGVMSCLAQKAGCISCKNGNGSWVGISNYWSTLRAPYTKTTPRGTTVRLGKKFEVIGSLKKSASFCF